MDDIVTFYATLDGEEYYIYTSTRDAAINKKKLVDELFDVALARGYDITREDIENTIEYTWRDIGQVYKS